MQVIERFDNVGVLQSNSVAGSASTLLLNSNNGRQAVRVSRHLYVSPLLFGTTAPSTVSGATAIEEIPPQKASQSRPARESAFIVSS